MPLETTKFQGVSRKLLRDSQKRTLWGSEFQRVGARIYEKEREPNWTLVRGTERSLYVATSKVGCIHYTSRWLLKIISRSWKYSPRPKTRGIFPT